MKRIFSSLKPHVVVPTRVYRNTQAMDSDNAMKSRRVVRQYFCNTAQRSRVRAMFCLGSTRYMKALHIHLHALPPTAEVGA